MIVGYDSLMIVGTIAMSRFLGCVVLAGVFHCSQKLHTSFHKKTQPSIKTHTIFSKTHTMRSGTLIALAIVLGAGWYLLHHPNPYAKETESALEAIRNAWELFKPGGKLHPTYFLEHQGHTAIEASLVVVIVLLYLQRSFKPPSRSIKPLTDKVRAGCVVMRHGLTL